MTAGKHMFTWEYNSKMANKIILQRERKDFTQSILLINYVILFPMTY